MDAHLREVLYLHVDNLVGQTELRDAVFQHTANLVQGLEDIDIIAFLHHIACKAESGRARANDGDLDAVGWSNLGQRDVAALTLIVSGETLQIANGHRL